MPYIHRNNIVDIDLNKSGTVFRSFANHCIGEGDVKGNVFGFRCLRNGEVQDLSSCTVMGYFIRADGYTVVMTGGVNENNIAYVRLPASCYVVEGNFTLAVKIYSGEEAGTMRIVDGTVVNTTTNAVIDPGGVVPDLSDLMAVIGRAEAAADYISGMQIGTSVLNGTRYRLNVTLPEEEEET